MLIVLPMIEPPVVPVGAIARPSGALPLSIVKPAPSPPSVTPFAVKRTVVPKAGSKPLIVVLAAPECDLTVKSFEMFKAPEYVPAPTSTVSPVSAPVIAAWIEEPATT